MSLEEKFLFGGTEDNSDTCEMGQRHSQTKSFIFNIVFYKVVNVCYKCINLNLESNQSVQLSKCTIFSYSFIFTFCVEV